MVKRTAKEISRAALLAAIADGATCAELSQRGGWSTMGWMRAVDGALQREMRAAMIVFGGKRRWELTDAGKREVCGG